MTKSFSAAADMANLYSDLTSIPVTFLAVGQCPNDEGKLVLQMSGEKGTDKLLVCRPPETMASAFDSLEGSINADFRQSLV